MKSGRAGWKVQGRRRRARGPLRRLGLVAAAGLPLALTPGAPQAALVDWLVLLVDVSASIDADEYRLQREAYVNVLQDQSIGTLLEGASITIVEFANLPELVVPWANDPVAAATSYAGHAHRIVGPGPGSTTGIARALKLALDLLEHKAGRRIIDISGDGPDNVDWFLGVWSQRVASPPRRRHPWLREDLDVGCRQASDRKPQTPQQRKPLAPTHRKGRGGKCFQTLQSGDQCRPIAGNFA